MIDRNILLPEFIYNPNSGHLGSILKYDDEFQIATEIKTDTVFQRILIWLQNLVYSSQWVPVKTREGSIVYLQKSNASFDRTARSRPEVIEALYVEKVWKKTLESGVNLGSFGYESVSAREAKKPDEKMLKRPNERLNGYLLTAGAVFIKEQCTRERGITKTKKNVVDMKTGERLARLVTEEQNVPGKRSDRVIRVKAEYKIMQVLQDSAAKTGIPSVHHFLEKGGHKAFLIEELFDSPLSNSEGKVPRNIREHADEISEQLIFGLRNIHAAGVSHNDIKGPNILIRKECNGKIKAVFTDFDMALQEARKSPSTSNLIRGAWAHFSPEKARTAGTKNVFSFQDECKADVWALGLELYRLHHGVYPEGWDEAKCGKDTKETMKQAILDLDQDKLLKGFKDENPVDQLIGKMLQIDPAKRFTMEEVSKCWNEIPSRR